MTETSSHASTAATAGDEPTTVLATTGATPDPGPAPRASVLQRRAKAAVARSAAGDRSATVLLGLVALALGVLAALLAFEVFGTGRAQRPLLDPVVLDVLRANPLLARVVALAVAVVALVLGLIWTARSLRPERRPDLVLDGGPDTAIVVEAGAAAETIGQGAAALAGVGRARARLVGTESAPALRLTLWLAEDAVVRDVLAGLEDVVLAQARHSMGLAALPAAVRLELDTAGPGPRVA